MREKGDATCQGPQAEDPTPAGELSLSCNRGPINRFPLLTIIFALVFSWFENYKSLKLYVPSLSTTHVLFFPH